MSAQPREQRGAPRLPLACPVVLQRRRGGPVTGRTEDVGPGGARVVVDRPLAVDEEVDFDLTLADAHLDGHARVLRQQGPNCYALRFERLDAAAAQALLGAVGRTG